MYVNLGIGLPTLTSNYVPEGVHIELQAENGLLGIGPYPATEAEASGDFINAGKETITAAPGASSFCSSDSFGMIRGSHIDLTILGGLQCSAMGDLASWIVPGKIIKVSFCGSMEWSDEGRDLILSKSLETGNGRSHGSGVCTELPSDCNYGPHRQGRQPKNLGRVFATADR
jgi:3-oxoacid CoA-transferase B subunit